MEDINLILSNALDRYFGSLSVLGYSSYKNVLSLIVLVGIKDILTYFLDYITDKDLHLIVKALDCISNNCFINIPTRFNEDASLFEHFKSILIPRSTEEDNLKITETGILKSF